MGFAIIFMRAHLSDLGILNIEELAEDFHRLHLVLNGEAFLHIDEGLHHLIDGHALERFDDLAEIA